MSIARRQIVCRQAPIIGLNSVHLICSPARPNYKYESPEERTQRRKESQQSRNERTEKRRQKRDDLWHSQVQKKKIQPQLFECTRHKAEEALAETESRGDIVKDDVVAPVVGKTKPAEQPLTFEEYLRTLTLKESTIKSVHRSLSVFKKILLKDPVFLKKYARSWSTINVAEFFANMSTDQWKKVFPFETKEQQEFYEIRHPDMKSKLRTYSQVTTLFSKEIAQQTPKIRESGRGTWLHARGLLVKWYLRYHRIIPCGKASNGEMS